jgi:ribosomal-protein-alanine N-acetyltransferase
VVTRGGIVVIEIRKAEIWDAPRMAEIAFSAWDSGIRPLFNPQAGQREAERSRLSKAAGSSWQLAIVACMSGIVVGWCSRSAKRSYIPYLFVLPDVQSNGIGAQLLQRMESVLELSGADRVQLETPADHVRAVRFYERQGYRILALRTDGSSGQAPFTSVHMEKQLNPYVGDIGED